MTKNIDKSWEDVEPFFNQAKKSIKHPHFYYALVDLDTKTITYKKKKWYKWLSGKRIVAVKMVKYEVRNM